MKEIFYNIKTIKDLVETIRARQRMYIDEPRISSLRSFIDGFTFALHINHIKLEDETIPFWFFYEWVSHHYNWGESTAGWCHIILKENKGDEEESLKVFFDLYDEFCKVEIISVQQRVINKQSLNFHYSDDCKTKVISDIEKWTKEPVYKNAETVYLLHLSNNWFIYYVIDGGSKQWKHTVFHNEISAKKQIESLFGNYSEWCNVIL